MNQRHYELTKQLLRRLREATAENLARLERDLLPADKPNAFALALAEVCKLSKDWYRTTFAGETLPLDLSGADLREGTFIGGEVWRGANFRNAQLDGSQWVMADADGADFTGASLQKIWTLYLFCGGASFQQANLSGALLDFGTKDKPADLSRAQLLSATIRITYDARFVLRDTAMRGCRVACNVVNAGTRDTYDAFLAAMSEKQKGEIINEITPQQLAQADQIVANNRPSKKSGGCFIATACYGSAEDPVVTDLRRFRDEILIRHAWGRMSSAVYHRYSPMVADWIRERTWARRWVRKTVVFPLAWLVRRLGPSKQLGDSSTDRSRLWP